jgi:hypothetical protein
MENSFVKPLNQPLFSSTFAPSTALRECELDMKVKNEKNPLYSMRRATINHYLWM